MYISGSRKSKTVDRVTSESPCVQSRESPWAFNVFFETLVMLFILVDSTAPGP